MRRSLFIYPLLLGLAALAGCATQSYESNAPKNLTLRAEVQSGGLFLSRGTQLGIYRVNAKCPLEYLGSVDLDDQPVKIGLEAGHKYYLNFLFQQSGNSGSLTLNHGAILTPRPGAQYAAKVSWADGMYDAKLQEIGRGGNVVREFDRQPSPCPKED